MEVIKGQNRLITLFRADNEDSEQQLRASSLENMSLKGEAKAAEDGIAGYRQLLSRYKREVQSCNAKILEVEKALQTGTGLVPLAVLLRDREKTIAELTPHLTIRVEEVAHLHQMESKYENHVVEMRTDLQCMYDANDSLEQEVRKMKKEVKRVIRANDSLQQKVTLFESKTLLMSRYNVVCNKHAILNILKTEKVMVVTRSMEAVPTAGATKILGPAASTRGLMLKTCLAIVAKTTTGGAKTMMTLA